MRAVGQLMGLAGGSLLGKLRIRMSTLTLGKLHTVDLPLQVGVRPRARGGSSPRPRGKGRAPGRALGGAECLPLGWGYSRRCCHGRGGGHVG